MKALTQAQYAFLLRHDLASFAGRCFQDLNPQTCLATNWHLKLIAAKLNASASNTASGCPTTAIGKPSFRYTLDSLRLATRGPRCVCSANQG
jgi:hypothetical protein